jgi:beta-galactosidase
VAGYNGDGAVLFLDPGVPNLVSEYGSCVADRPGEFAPNFSDNVDKAYPWRSGKALWCAFHHGSIFAGMGHMGMIDYARLPLNTWYWYRQAMLGIAPPEPRKPGIPYALRLSCDRAAIRADGTDDAQIVVHLPDRDGREISGELAVTLRNEGVGCFPTGRSIVLTKENGCFTDGLGAIEFRAYYGGGNCITAEAEGLRPGELSLEGVGAEPWDGQAENR